MRTVIVLGLCVAWLAAPAAGDAPAKKMERDGLTVEVFAADAYVVPGGPGMKMFSNRDAKLDKCPPEFKGFLGIQMPLEKAQSRLEFAVSRPARVFAPFYGITRFGESRARWDDPRPPDGWRLYAFEKPIWHGDSDIYYRDFPAGRHAIEVGSWLLIPAVVPQDRLTEAMKFLASLDRPEGKEYFLPGEEASLVVTLDNQTGAPRQTVIEWADLPTAGRRVQGGTRETICPPGELRVPIPLGTLKERGLYRVAIKVTSGSVTHDLWAPVGVFPKPEKRVTWDENTFPVGPYLKPHVVSGKFGMYTETYFRATCDELSRRGFTILKNAETLKELDIAAEYGMKAVVFFRRYYSEKALRHPAAIAAMVMDEVPFSKVAEAKAEYDAIARINPDIPIITCEVGESTGTFSDNDPLRVWPVLDAKLRMFRYYPFRKADYDLARYPVYKGWLPVDAALRVAEAAADTPYWFVAQTFGEPVSEARPEPYWRLPNAVELKAHLHHALARGAQGLLFYTYQDEPPRVAMADQKTLDPHPTGLLDAAGEIARLTRRHGRLLKELRFGGVEAVPSERTVLAVPRYRGKDAQAGDKYIYLVNLCADAPAAGALKFGATVKPFPCVDDVYSGERIQTSRSGVNGTVPYRLPPGGAALLKIVADETIEPEPRRGDDPG